MRLRLRRARKKWGLKHPFTFERCPTWTDFHFVHWDVIVCTCNPDLDIRPLKGSPHKPVFTKWTITVLKNIYLTKSGEGGVYSSISQIICSDLNYRFSVNLKKKKRFGSICACYNDTTTYIRTNILNIFCNQGKTDIHVENALLICLLWSIYLSIYLWSIFFFYSIHRMVLRK